MSISLTRLRSLNVLQHVLSPREGNLNLTLKREFSAVCSSRTLEGERLPFLIRVPSRGFYKQQIEVEKRIQWKRPVKVQSVLPEKSGDLSGLPEVDLNAPLPLFELSKEYQTANDLVKRVFSLKFQSHTHRKDALKAAVVQKVQRHQYDLKSVEVKFARWTAIIRNMQLHYANFPRDKQGKADLKEIIEFRKKRLRLLRTLDYRRFEWLLVNLDLLFKPAPKSFERVERKKSMRWLTEEYIESVKEKKLDQYREVLESKKREFIQKKLSTMKTINEEEMSIGVEPSFTPADIEAVEVALRQRIIEEEKRSPTVKEVKETY